MILFPCHRLSAKPTHRLSADSLFTHLYISFVMGLPVVNASPDGQYQLVCNIEYLTSNGSYLVSWLSFLILFEPRWVKLFVQQPTLGEKVLFMTDFLINWTELVIKLTIGDVQIKK